MVRGTSSTGANDERSTQRAEILKKHVTLIVEGIDRMYLNVYVPRLQTAAGVASFFRFHRGHTFASSVLMAPISQAFVGAIEGSPRGRHSVEAVREGEDKEDVAAEYRAAFQAEEGIYLIGKAQEKARVFGPRSVAIRRRARAIRGSCPRRRWSISTTSTDSTATLVRSS